MLRLADRRLSGDAPIDMPLTQEDIAAAATLTRKTAGIILRSLEEEGHIALGYRNLSLVALPALRRIADGGQGA